MPEHITPEHVRRSTSSGAHHPEHITPGYIISPSLRSIPIDPALMEPTAATSSKIILTEAEESILSVAQKIRDQMAKFLGKSLFGY